MLFQKNPNRCVLILGLILLLFSASLFYFLSKPSERIQNIVIISIDALNWSALRTFDPKAPVLPAIDAFAEDAAVFRNAYSTASWTLPAHASLFTGLYPDRHGAHHLGLMLAPDIPMLGGYLRDFGFYAAAFTGGGFVSNFYGFGQGFDRYDDWRRPEAMIDIGGIPRDGKQNEVAGQNLFDRGIAFIQNFEKRRGSEKFFLFLHTFMVHDYFQLHPWAVERVPIKPDKKSTHYRRCIGGDRKCAEKDWTVLKSLYDAEVYRLNDGFSRLLEALEEKDLLASTLIVFLSDHGEGFEPEHHRIHHGGRLHHDVIRIPLIISGPGIAAQTSDLPVSLVDIMPTLLDLLEIPFNGTIDGTSFAKTLTGKGEEDDPSRERYAFEHYYRWDQGKRLQSDQPMQSAISVSVMKNDYWFIRDPDALELYDMKIDPLQYNNMAAGSPLVSDLDNFARKRIPDRPYTGEISTSAAHDEELLRQLRSLGYLQ